MPRKRTRRKRPASTFSPLGIKGRKGRRRGLASLASSPGGIKRKLKRGFKIG